MIVTSEVHVNNNKHNVGVAAAAAVVIVINIVSTRDRAEKHLRMSRNCSEKVGDTRVFATFLRLNYYFAANFRQVFKDETVVFKRYFVPLLQDGL